MSPGNIVPLSIAPMALVEKVAHDAQVVPTSQHTAAQQQVVEAMQRESKLVQKIEEANPPFKVDDESEEEHSQKHQDAHDQREEKKAPEEKPDAPARPLAGHLLDVKI